MKVLLTKVLFISLLSFAVIPSVVQAMGSEKLSKAISIAKTKTQSKKPSMEELTRLINLFETTRAKTKITTFRKMAIAAIIVNFALGSCEQCYWPTM